MADKKKYQVILYYSGHEVLEVEAESEEDAEEKAKLEWSMTAPDSAEATNVFPKEITENKP